MKNLIKYYYNLDIDNIIQKDNDYILNAKGCNYLLTKCNISNIRFIYTFIKNNYNYHNIILTLNNNLVINIENNDYILMKINCISRQIDIDDIKECDMYVYNDQQNKYIKDLKNELITNSEDAYNYINNLKNKKISKVYEYNIGLAENAIQLLSIINNDFPLFISHYKINNRSNLIDLYSPANLLLGSRVNDYVNYFKSMFFLDYDRFKIEFEKIYKFIDELIINEKILFLSLFIYPSYFFNNNLYDKDNNNLLNSFNMVDLYEEYIKKIYKYIKKEVYFIKIDWLD